MLFLDAIHKKKYTDTLKNIFYNQILVNIVLHFVPKSMLIVIMAVRHLQLLRPIFVVHMTIILKPLNTALKKNISIGIKPESGTGWLVRMQGKK